MKTLRDWRIERLMSVRNLADAAGVSTKTVIQLEYGRQQPTYRSMRRLCNALSVSPSEVVEFAATMEERGKDAA